jgi:hypothetical protein
MFGNKKSLAKERQAKGGEVAWASVLDVHYGMQSARMNGFNQVQSTTEHDRITVRVEQEGAGSFEATFRQVFKDQKPMSGWQCKVIYDPRDHERIAVVEGTFMPPGIDHDRAERALDRRTEMKAALRDGNMAKYIEKRKADALAQAQAGTLKGLVMVDGKVISGGGLAPQVDVADQLTKLAALRDQGILTDAKFEAQKAKLLSSG